MAKVKRQIEVPKVETREVEVEVDDNDPTLVHERFEQAHRSHDLPIFIASALRKVAQHLHSGKSVARAMESAAEEIEEIATSARDDVPGDEGRDAVSDMTADEVSALRRRYENEKQSDETFETFINRVAPRRSQQ